MRKSQENKMKNGFYITTTIPYVNADPHVGFALEIIHPDIVVRYRRLMGQSIFFNTGTDEHGAKVYNKAKEEGRDPQEYTDEYSEKFRNLTKILGLYPGINFIRTTDKHHIYAAQEFWKKCKANGDIYKKFYQIKYCNGCELEKTDSELVNGICPIHPNLKIEFREEENYFFALSTYQDKLVDLYKKNPNFVMPRYRLNEITSLIAREGLQDFSISRIKNKMPWGVEVPDDPEQVMYVWFDAFINYISAIGWPDDLNKFNTWWPVIQVAGKDQVRQQAVMWQAMLMSANIAPSEQIFIHGFINSGGQKMSKSLGNVIDPYEVVKEYGTEALRYYLAREVSFFEDSDFTMDKFKASYNANLANGIGNLTSRIMKMATTYEVSLSEAEKNMKFFGQDQPQNEYLEKFNIKGFADNIWDHIQNLDEHIQKEQPFKKIKTDPEAAKKDVHYLLIHLLGIALKLEPLLPETSRKIRSAIIENKMPESLFARKD